MEACGRLHNFIITQQADDDLDNPVIDPFQLPEGTVDPSRTALGYVEGQPPTPEDLDMAAARLYSVQGVSLMRNYYRDFIKRKGYEWPQSTIDRRQEQDAANQEIY